MKSEQSSGISNIRIGRSECNTLITLIFITDMLLAYPVIIDDIDINMTRYQGAGMQVAVVEKTFRIVGKGSLIAQFTFISSGTLHIWFPDVGLQMEAHCKQLRIEDCTIIYTNGLHHGQPRALWSLTLHPDDMNELKRILQQFNTSLYLTCQPPTMAIAKQALSLN
ncbi:hypothetical protein RI534_19320 [Aeromonas allosaccharophila]|uniref:hypothetical protein n=1 Tax=Aeromonas allosaccharophila TaxID=656 RepID=UPI0034397825